MSDGRVWADEHGVLGQLQRGRGLGFLRALDDEAAARPDVVSCVIHDPRWDRQLEARAWFYAALIDHLQIDVRELRPAFEGPWDPSVDDVDYGAFLATDVLEFCARRGVAGAVGELRNYLRSGRDLELALLHLLPLSTHPEADGLADDLVGVADQAKLANALSFGDIDFSRPPWPQWRLARPALHRIATSALAHQQDSSSPVATSHLTRWTNARTLGPPPPRIGQRGETTEELLAGADADPLSTALFAGALGRRYLNDKDRALVTETARSGSGSSREAALVALGWQGDDALLDIGLPLIDHATEPLGRAQRAVLKGLRRLSSPRAVAWARATTDGDGFVGYTARGVLCRSADTADLPLLRDLLSAAITGHQVYDGCNLVDAIYRLNDLHSVGLITQAFVSTEYSWLRRRCSQRTRRHVTNVLRNPRLRMPLGLRGRDPFLRRGPCQPLDSPRPNPLGGHGCRQHRRTTRRRRRRFPARSTVQTAEPLVGGDPVGSSPLTRCVCEPDGSRSTAL